MPLFFAYGSNMDIGAMARRCPASRAIGRAKLMGFRFIISTDGYATVIRERGAAVWGIGWDLALADVPPLDRYESLSTGLYSKMVQPVLTDQGARRCLVYIGRSTRPGPPKPGYAEGVAAAAADAGLPADYLRELMAWVPKAPGAATGPFKDRFSPPPETQAPAVRPLWAAPTSGRNRPVER
ncbi:MAG: gamma-glutamylcyclotransferase family protein [Microvirga sp.]